MSKDFKSIAHLSFLYVLFLAGLVVFVWGALNLTASYFYATNGGYASAPVDMGCAQNPPKYPSTFVSGSSDSQGSGDTTKSTSDYNQQIEDYNKQQAEYDANAYANCLAQQKEQNDFNKSQELAAIYSYYFEYGVALFIGLIIMIISGIFVKKSHKK